MRSLEGAVRIVLTERSILLARAVLAVIVCPSVLCSSVCHKSEFHYKMAKPRITKTTTYNSPARTHFSNARILCEIPTGSHTGTVVRQCCKDDDQSQWEKPKCDPPATRACERSVSGAENGAERVKNSWSGSGAVSGL